MDKNQTPIESNEGPTHITPPKPSVKVSRAERRRIERKLRELPIEQHEIWMKMNGYSFRT